MNALHTAQHEAAHLCVGLSVGGLRVVRATIRPDGDTAGYVEWEGKTRESWALMFAAGVAWERRVGDLEKASFDLAELRKLRVRGNAAVAALERAAWALLETRASQHARITRALLEGDLDHRGVMALFRRA